MTLSALVSVLILASCKPKETETIYTITQGAHDATPRTPKVVDTDWIEFDARFIEGAIYTSQIPANQQDINKLYGFSDCNSAHDQNSARIGWRWLNGHIEILSYAMAGGVRTSTLMGAVMPGEIHRFKIETQGSQYVFKLDDQTVIEPRGCESPISVRYQLFPYFGGDETAPHIVKIGIKDYRNSDED